MTDYLEEQEEQAQALEENLARLEEALVALGPGASKKAAGVAEESAAPAFLPGSQIAAETETALIRARDWEKAEEGENRTSFERGEESSPLLEQAEALEAALAGLDVLRTGTGEESAFVGPWRGAAMGREEALMQRGSRQQEKWPDRLLPRSGAADLKDLGLGGETRPGSPRSGAAAWDGETEEARRMDRIFRRDSRRYDGGFFLY